MLPSRQARRLKLHQTSSCSLVPIQGKTQLQLTICDSTEATTPNLLHGGLGVVKESTPPSVCPSSTPLQLRLPLGRRIPSSRLPNPHT